MAACALYYVSACEETTARQRWISVSDQVENKLFAGITKRVALCQLCFVGSCKGAARCAPTKVCVYTYKFKRDMRVGELPWVLLRQMMR
jgi:hypothetical protein